MQAHRNISVTGFLYAVVLIMAGLSPESARAASTHGLWVGQITLTRANEVSVPLDSANNPIAPNPAVATPTADAAYLRLILHVNGAGQVSLIKDVAILNRVSGSSGSNIVNLVTDVSSLEPEEDIFKSESDFSLVTDERLYPEFPVQAGVRIASAVFDFGDSLATDAVNAVVDSATTNAAMSIASSSENFRTSAGRVAAEAAAQAAALDSSTPGNAQEVVDNANVARDFSQFLIDHFPSSLVNTLADENLDPVAESQAALIEATNLLNRSFYMDDRAVSMINGVVDAVLAAETKDKTNVAHNTTASFADVDNLYQRHLGSKNFGDMIAAGAAAAASATLDDGASSNSVRAAVNSDPTYVEKRDIALLIKTSPYADTRMDMAVQKVTDALIDSAVTNLQSTINSQDEIQSLSIQAGRFALQTNVARFTVPPRVPTEDYNVFVQSEDFQESAVVAAEAAANGAAFERVNNALYTDQSIENAARVEAVKALNKVYGAAARAVRTELPLNGIFGLGQGDTRLTLEIDPTNDPPLGEPGLVGTIYLPANHPTNPFRHRIHPDHTSGFDIQRNIRLDFNGMPDDSLEPAGFGVDRITGVYREEIFGLHKPLGSKPDTDPIGLKVEGAFELNRISLIDTLNAL